VDFLATQYGAVWSWFHTLVPVVWLSFVLVVVLAWLPFDLWKIFDKRARLRKTRHLSHWKELHERVKAAAAGSERYPVWQGQQSIELVNLFDPVVRPGCMSTIFSWILAGFNIALILAAWAVLEDPLQGMEPGSSLGSAICGELAQGVSCLPGTIGIYGFDFRSAPIDGMNAVGWGVFGIWFGMPLYNLRSLIAHPKSGSANEKDHRKSIRLTLVFLVGLTAVMLFLPAGVLVIGLVRRIENVLVRTYGQLPLWFMASRWESRIDTELELLTPPDKFFVPELRGEGSSRESRTRAVIAKLLDQAKQTLEEQCSEDEVQLTERISLLGSVPRLGDIRMVITPKAEGSVVAFLGENVDTVRVVEEIMLDMWGCEVEDLPIAIAEVIMSDMLIDGRRVPGEE
jgi:hypothetical protein